jgi:hypothetical protein
MTNEDQALITGAVIMAVQTLKPLPKIHASFYGVVALAVGVGAGCLISYGRTGTSGLVDGAIAGLKAALEASGLYSISKSMGAYQPPAKLPRDAQGRFAKKERT